MRRLVVLVAATGLAAGGAIAAAPAASAATDPVPSPATGRTSVTTNTSPNIAAALVRAGVLPYTISPGRTDRVRLSPLSLTYSFPITGAPDGLAGEVTHSGGIAFVKLGSLTKRITVRNFTIDLNGPNAGSPAAVDQPAQGAVLVGTVADGPGGVPDGARVALFDIDLSGAAVDVTDTQVTGAVLKLRPVAAAALNAELGTSVFTPGLPVFTARANA